MNPYLEQILGQGPAAEAEAQCVDAFVKQASAEGIDLAQLPDQTVEQLYEGVFKPKFAEALEAQGSADGLIEKAAAEGASEDVLEKLAMAKLTGEAMAEGYLERMGKFAQEAEALGGEETPAEEAAEAEGGEGGGAAEAAQAIVEDAVQEAVEEVAQAAEAQGVEASPEEIAQAAAPMVEQKVEEKTSALLEYMEEQEKTAAGPVMGMYRSEMAGEKAVGRLRGLGRFAKANPALAAVLAGGGAAAGAGGMALAKRKRAADMVAEALLEKEAEGEAAKAPGRMRRAYDATKGHIGRHTGKYGLGAGIAAGAGGALLARKLLAKKAADILAEEIEKDAEGASRIRRVYEATKGHIGRHTGKYGLGAGAAAGAGGALLARKLLAKKGK
jgi:hypothetical protein